MRDAIFEALPRWRCYCYIVSEVDAPVGPGKNLLRIVGVYNDRIHWDIRKISGLVYPCERAAVGRAGYLKNMARCGWRVSVKASHRSIAYGQIGSYH